MKFLCGRPGCGKESTATLQIDAISESVSLVDPRISRDGVPLCARHADATTPPLGWAMNDLRSTSRALNDTEEAAVEETPPRVRPRHELADKPGARMSSRQSIKERARRSGEPDPDEFEGEEGDAGDAEVIDLNDVPARVRARRERADKQQAGRDRTGRSSARRRADAEAKAPDTRPTRRRAVDEDDEPSQQEMFPWHYEFGDEDEPEELQASSPLLSRAFRATTGH